MHQSTKKSKEIVHFVPKIWGHHLSNSLNKSNSYFLWLILLQSILIYWVLAVDCIFKCILALDGGGWGVVNKEWEWIALVIELEWYNWISCRKRKRSQQNHIGCMKDCLANTPEPKQPVTCRELFQCSSEKKKNVKI